MIIRFAVMGPSTLLTPKGKTEQQVAAEWRDALLRCGFTYAQAVRHQTRMMTRAIARLEKIKAAKDVAAVWLFGSNYVVREDK